MAKNNTRSPLTGRQLWTALALAVALTLIATVAITKGREPRTSTGLTIEEHHEFVSGEFDRIAKLVINNTDFLFAIETKIDMLEAKLDRHVPPPAPPQPPDPPK